MNLFSQGTMLQVSKSKFMPVKLSLGNATYIVGKDSLGKHHECIYSFPYNRSSDKEPHYDFKKMFIVEDKLLEVTACSRLKYGPLGDNTNVQVYYDGQLISNLHAHISYMGGSVKGVYPYIKTKKGQIVFSIQIVPSKKDNIWSIDYYSNVLLQTEELNFANSEQLCFEIQASRSGYTFNDIEHVKKTHWIHPVYDTVSKKYLGDLSFCEYPGYNQYGYWVTGTYEMGEKIPHPVKIEQTDDNEFLQTLELRCNEQLERVVISNGGLKGISKESFLKNPF